MAQEQPTTSPERVPINRGADDQLTALERLWALGETVDPRIDEEAWQTLRSALNETRRRDKARLLFEDDQVHPAG
jgi:hypothetical protein